MTSGSNARMMVGASTVSSCLDSTRHHGRARHDDRWMVTNRPTYTSVVFMAIRAVTKRQAIESSCL